MDMRPTYTLEPWQTAAVTAWTNSRHPERGTHHGILHVYTGAGKSVLAAAAMVEASRVRPGTKFAVVVPTAALAGQWVKMIPKMTTLSSNRVGKVGDGEQASFDNNDVVVYVLASARRIEHGRSRLATDAEGHKVMLIVDECHKAGSKEGQKIFDVKSWACLGLSATPNREDADNMDVYGSPLAVEKQPHGRAIGPVCFTRDLRDGILDGCLPRFKFVHHAVNLTPSEQREYDEEYERNVFKKSKALKDAGGEPRHYQGYISGRMRCTNGVRAAAGELQQAYFARKQFLYTASERLRIASLVLEEAFAEDPPLQGALIFNERVGDRKDGDEDESEATFGAVQLVAHLREAAHERMFPFDADAIALEHSHMPKAERDAAIEGLRTGDVSILVSVKALQEGLDVPDVGLGMSIASTASGRQRIQTMGRILRPPRDPKTGRRLDPKDHPQKQIHFFFVKGSPDEELYRKESWGNFFTVGNNEWIEWACGADEGEFMAPLIPPLSEREAWHAIANGPFPATWSGPQRGLTLSWKQTGVSIPGTEVPITNRAEVEGFLSAARTPRGRVLVTPDLGVALTWAAPQADGFRPVMAWGRVAVNVEGAENATFENEAQSTPNVASTGESTTSDVQLIKAERERRQTTLEGRTAIADMIVAEVGGRWYQLVQQACIAWVADDEDTFDAAAELLAHRKGKARFGRALLDALQGPPTETALGFGKPVVPMSEAFQANPFSVGHAEKAVIGGAAAAVGRTDVVRKIADEYEHLARGRDSMLGLANALRILAGDSNAMLVVEDDE